MEKKNENSRVNVYQMVTDRIMEQLKQNIIPWHKPWVGGLMGGEAINYVSRKPYSCLNQLLLGRDGEYLTFRQIKQLGGSVKKGAKAGMVVFYTMVKIDKSKNNEDGKENKVEEYQYPVLRFYNVFHISDTVGIESKVKAVVPEIDNEPIEEAEKVINDYLDREKKLEFINDQPSSRAYYSPLNDRVVVPMLSQYKVREEYYSTTFHELVHSTKQPYRCDRKSEDKRVAFGSKDYSREELVAEIGSAMICNKVGINCETAFSNSVAYIQGWLKALADDNRCIVWAASRAEKAAKYILNESEDNK